MKTQAYRNRLASAALGLLLLGFTAHAQHGVIREYAALAPEPDAVPLAPLFDAPLTDASITLGPDKALYLAGSAVEGGGAAFSSRIPIWRSADMRQWAKIRTLDFGAAQFRSPEIHFLDGAFWLTLGRKGGGTELLKFDTADPATSAFRKVQITARGEDPSLFRDDNGTFYWTTGGGEIARLQANPLDGLASEPANPARTNARCSAANRARSKSSRFPPRSRAGPSVSRGKTRRRDSPSA